MMRFIQLIIIIGITIVSCKNSKHSTVKVEEDTVKTELDSNRNLGDETANRTNKQFSDSVFAQLQRTPCFGRCGIYTITVFKSGLVRYEGEKWVEKEGVYEARVSPEVLQDLLRYAKEINFFELQDEYDNKQVTDLPSTITSVRNKEGIKTIENRYDGPKELSEFERYFDGLFEQIEWKRVSEIINN